MTVHSPPTHDLQEPPPPTLRVLAVGLVGVGLVAVAFVYGLAAGAPRQGFDVHWADGQRALLSCVGLLLTGCAVSMRPGWFGGWLCAAAAGLIGYGLGGPPPAGTEWYLAPPRDWYAGVPNAWDSVQLFFGVSAGVGLVGAILTNMPRRVVLSFMLVWVAYHFAGIVSAITSPPPTPWLADQYWKRIGKPYLQFAYMNNAYQFYSPDPGPACELWVCVDYRPEGRGDDPDAPKECEWHYIPRREINYVDPLGLSLYRRLSLTENVAQYQPPGYVALPAEVAAAEARRARAGQDPERGVPRMGYPTDYERRVPNDLVVRQILPSFARHLAKQYARPGKEVHSVKIYRTLHLITTLPQFRGYEPNIGQKIMAWDAYMPSLYLPYFQGEFDVKGELKDPRDPLLYWWVPIYNAPKNNRFPATLEEYRRNIERYGNNYYFTDTVSRHAGCDRPTGKGRP
jgi:hypothetical protein